MANPLARAARRLQRKTYRPNELLAPVHLDRQARWTTWKTDRAIREGFKASTWVYTCVFRIMKSVASVPWLAQRRIRDPDVGDSWEDAPTAPLTQILERPNPYQSRQDVMERVSAHLELGGNGLLNKIRVGGRVVELWPVDPSGLKPIPSRTEFLSRYEYDKDGVTKRIDAKDVIHFMFTDPGNQWWGMGPLEAAARTVDTDVEAVKWNKIALQNRAITDVVFSASEPLDAEQWQELREQVRQEYEGRDNARRPWVLGGGVKPFKLALSPAEMDFIESRKLTREEICAVFEVPPPMVGIYDQATLTNIITARRIFWEDTVVPLLEDLQSGFQRALVPEFGDPDEWRLAFDTSNVPALQEDFSKKVGDYVKLVQHGIPPNMAAERVGLDLGDEIPGGDVGYISSTLTPLLLPAGIGPQDGDVDEEDDD